MAQVAWCAIERIARSILGTETALRAEEKRERRESVDDDVTK
jgi:hypothetical protein